MSFPIRIIDGYDIIYAISIYVVDFHSGKTQSMTERGIHSKRSVSRAKKNDNRGVLYADEIQDSISVKIAALEIYPCLRTNLLSRTKARPQ